MKYEVTKPTKKSTMLDSFFGDRFLDDFLVPGREMEQFTDWIPAVDIVDKGDKYVVKADLPGIEEKDISVEVKDEMLTIKGERKHEHESEGDNVYRCERDYGSFTRSFSLDGIKEEEIRADYKNGILTDELPKAEERRTKKIEIRH